MDLGTRLFKQMRDMRSTAHIYVSRTDYGDIARRLLIESYGAQLINVIIEMPLGLGNRVDHSPVSARLGGDAAIGVYMEPIFNSLRTKHDRINYALHLHTRR